MINMMSLLTLLTLRSARTSSPLNAMKHPNRFSTALPLLVMTQMLCPTDMLDTDMASVMPMLKLSLDIPLVLSVKTRRTGSAKRSQSKTPARSPAQCARLLLTPPTSRSARKPSPPSATLLTLRFTTALLLLVMTLKLLLMVMADMVDMVIRSVKLRLKLSPGMESAVDLSAMPRRTGSATRSLSRALTRSLDKSVFQLQGRNAILLRSRYPDKSAITLDMESSTHLTTAMDMATVDKVFKHLLHFPHTKQCFS